MIRDQSFLVEPSETGLRLDRLLTGRFPAVSKTLIQDALAHDGVLVNGRRAAKGLKMRAGDQVVVARLLEGADRRALPDPQVALDILFEDEWMIVLNKPAGMAVHPLKPDETGTLANGLVARHPELADIGDNPLFPALVHRIDTETSGLVLAAKSEAAFERLRRQFSGQTVTKVYLALAHGALTQGGTLEGYLTHQGGAQCVMKVLQDFHDPARPDVFKAITHYQVEKRWPRYSLLRITIPTGVTHQIRCQLAGFGHPIVGDRIYGRRTPLDKQAPRHFLHAYELELKHPRDGRTVAFQAPCPADLLGMLRQLDAG